MECRAGDFERKQKEEQREKFTKLLELPKEIIVEILRYLPLNDLDVAFRELSDETFLISLET